MAIFGTAVNFSTLLLEKNRWNGKGPSLLVTDWIEPIGEAGFSGVDIWINHLLLSSRSDWDAIRDLCSESDLVLACLSTALPTDDGDKSQRFRDSILEACDYFRPEGLKFNLPDEGPRHSLEDALGDSLEVVRAWSQDLARDTILLYEPSTDENAVEKVSFARKALPAGRFKGVLHPFLLSLSDFDEALASNGDFIGDLGVQAQKSGQYLLLEDAEDEFAAVVAKARKRGYQGTWSLQFTKGVATPGLSTAKENIDTLFDNAERDLNFLIDAIALSGKSKATR